MRDVNRPTGAADTVLQRRCEWRTAGSPGSASRGLEEPSASPTRGRRGAHQSPIRPVQRPLAPYASPFSPLFLDPTPRSHTVLPHIARIFLTSDRFFRRLRDGLPGVTTPTGECIFYKMKGNIGAASESCLAGQGKIVGDKFTLVMTMVHLGLPVGSLLTFVGIISIQ